MNHSWAPALDGYAGIEASPDSIRARNLRARNSRAARPCSSLWSTSNIHSHIIGHRTLDDIEVCQQSGGRSGSAGADGPALFRNDPPRSGGSGEKLSKLQLGKQNSESVSLLVELARAENPPGSVSRGGRFINEDADRKTSLKSRRDLLRAYFAAPPADIRRRRHPACEPVADRASA